MAATRVPATIWRRGEPRDGSGAGIAARVQTGALAEAPRQPRRWELWFPARLGPKHKRKRTVNGVKVEVRVKVPELPPGPNGSRGNPIAHGQWVKGWRESARDIARAAVGEIEPLRRARVTAIMRRTRIGQADPDNDMARCKPLLDGLRDAKVLRRDTYQAVELGQISEERAGAEGPGVLLIVEELE
jgi:hypothetical protein